MIDVIKKYLLPVLLAAALLPADSTAQKKVVGYYPGWNKTTYPHTAIAYENLTHIVHAFIFPYADGTLDLTTFTPYPELIASAHNHNVKIAIAVGGWDNVRTPRFSQMAADTAARHAFISAMISFINTHNYDGIDIDWEYPKTAADRSNMTLLVHELRTAMNMINRPLSLSMAGPATWWSGQWFDFAAMINDFEWIGVMTYDFYGAWTSKAGPNAALYGNSAQNTEGWIDYSYSYYNGTRGVPKEKLLIGIPFYGQVFNASSLYGTSTGATQSTYTNIMPKLSQGWTRHWDAVGRVPYLLNSSSTQLISYDDSQSVAEKCLYVNTKGSGGAIIWAIGQDQYQGTTPLLSVAGEMLLSPVAVRSEHPFDVPAQSTLHQNYPNPFNGDTVIRFTIGRSGYVTAALYDMLGRQVRLLAQGEYEPGEYSLTVSSQNLASGIYLYRLTNNGNVFTRTMIVLR